MSIRMLSFVLRKKYKCYSKACEVLFCIVKLRYIQKGVASMAFKPLPIGIEDFREVIEQDYYYVDKTLFIKELLDMRGKVNLFTRPRRFGKTLNISMLRYFFDINQTGQKELFSDTDISKAGDKYLKHMGKYPVIMLSLKSMKQMDFSMAYAQLKRELGTEYHRYWEQVLACEKITQKEKERYEAIMNLEGQDADYYVALRFLSDCLMRCYNQKTVILIDEYDVPLENAHFQGFYDEMSALIRSLFESALKTNENLEFAVITGCLRISKESIFTGLNNLGIISILSAAYDEYFGFTQEEVDRMLEFYGITRNRENIKKWYDGYLFGQVEVYNPWSVVNYVEACNHNPEALPLPYWSNTSSNSIVRSLVERADSGVRQEIEALIEGKTILKPIHEDITYEDIDSSQDNLWNFLFFTGYLKKICEKQEEEIRYIEMAIPNSEVRYIYKTTVLRWFEEKIEKKDLSLLYKSVLEGNEEETEKILSDNLMETISFYDYQESFYHGFLVGMFKNIENYIVLSNRESGNGRPDILLKYPSVRGKAIIIELKVAKTFRSMQEKCEEALKQIEKQRYEEALREEGYSDIIKYGIAFYRKECMVRKGC